MKQARTSLIIALFLIAISCERSHPEVRLLGECDSTIAAADRYFDDLVYHLNVDSSMILYQSALECAPDSCRIWRTLLSLSLTNRLYNNSVALLQNDRYCRNRNLLDTSLLVSLVEHLGDSASAISIIDHAIQRIGVMDEESFQRRDLAWRIEYILLLRKAKERYNHEYRKMDVGLLIGRLDEFARRLALLELPKLDSAYLQLRK